MARSAQTHTAKKREAEQKCEEKYTAASAALNNGTYKTMTEAAAAFNVDYHTLRRRHKHLTRPHSKAHENDQLLRGAQEQVLCDWVAFLGMTGHPISKSSLKAKVFDLSERLQAEARATGEKKGPGRRWVEYFLRRHPEIKLSRPTGLDPKRAQNFNYTTVQHHFTLLGKFLESNSIPWENVYNMDEKGIQLGGGRKGDNTKYLYSRSQKARVRMSSGNLELVTVIECVCADGSNIRPGFVFSGTKMHQEWFDEENILVALSENGWTSNFIGAEWFEKVFVPQAKAHNASAQPILLIYDGHQSHETIKLRQVAETHGIHLFCLPAHTTHRLQPLDVGIFGPLQRAWQQRCNQYLEEHGQVILKKDVIREYMKARESAFKEETIIHAWKKCGMCPLNPGIFTEEDYAPSYATSTSAHVPATFPSSLPLSGEESSDDTSYKPSETESTTTKGDNETSDVEDQPNCDQLRTLSHTGLQLPSNDAQSSLVSSMLQDSLSRAPSPFERLTPSSDVRSHRRTSSRLSSRSNTPSHGNLSAYSSHRSSRLSNISFSSSRENLIKELEYARDRLQIAEAENHELKDEIEKLRNLNSAAETHCHLAHIMLEDSQRKLNEKSTTRNKGAKKITSMSRVLTTEEGRAELRQLEAQEEEQRQLEVIKQKKKVDEELEKQRRRAEQEKSAVFTGMLHSKKKEELSDIAACLRLDDQGTVSTLVERIKTFFDANPAIKQSERYTGLRLDRLRSRGTKRTARDHLDDNASQNPQRKHAYSHPASQVSQLPVPSSSQHKRARTSPSSASNIQIPTLSSPAMSLVVAHGTCPISQPADSPAVVPQTAYSHIHSYLNYTQNPFSAYNYRS